MKRHVPYWLLLLALCLLCGCYVKQSDAPTKPVTGQEQPEYHTGATTAPSAQEASVMEPNYTFWQDNRSSTYLLTGLPSSDGKGFYFRDTTLKYYDISQQASFTPCARPGCTHTDESCPNFIAGLLDLLEADGLLYAFCEDQTARRLRLLRINPADGERSVLYELRWSDERESSPLWSTCFYSSGRIYATVSNVTNGAETLFLCVTLADGSVTELAQTSETTTGGLLGAYGDCVLLEWTTYSMAPPEFDAYLAENPGKNEEDYYSFLYGFHKKYATQEVRRLDVTTMEYTDIQSMLCSGSNAEALNTRADAGIPCYGQYLLYTVGKSICRYSLATQQVETLVSDINFTYRYQYDGRLFYGTKNGQKMQCHILDLQTGAEITLHNNGNTEYVEFGIYDETAEAFIGYYNGKQCWITKEDYYAERYDKAVSYDVRDYG